MGTALDPGVDPLTYFRVLLDGVFDRAGRGGQGIQVAEQQHIARRAPEPLADAAGLQFLHYDDEIRSTRQSGDDELGAVPGEIDPVTRGGGDGVGR